MITKIIDSETRPRGQKKAHEAYNRFVATVISNTEPLAKAA
jgi:hypothetical protein